MVAWAPASNPDRGTVAYVDPDGRPVYVNVRHDPRTAAGFVALDAQLGADTLVIKVGKIPASIGAFRSVSWVAAPGIVVMVTAPQMALADVVRIASGLRAVRHRM